MADQITIVVSHRFENIYIFFFNSTFNKRLAHKINWISFILSITRLFDYFCYQETVRDKFYKRNLINFCGPSKCNLVSTKERIITPMLAAESRLIVKTSRNWDWAKTKQKKIAELIWVDENFKITDITVSPAWFNRSLNNKNLCPQNQLIVFQVIFPQWQIK